MKEFVSDFFYRLIRPAFWIQNHRTSYQWDALLNQLLDSSPEIKRGFTGCTHFINGVEIWTENYPYAFGGPRFSRLIPRPKTRVRLREVIDLRECSFEATVVAAIKMTAGVYSRELPRGTT